MNSRMKAEIMRSGPDGLSSPGILSAYFFFLGALGLEYVV